MIINITAITEPIISKKPTLGESAPSRSPAASEDSDDTPLDIESITSKTSTANDATMKINRPLIRACTF